MTEHQVVALVGKPYEVRLARSEIGYGWMNDDKSHKVNVTFAHAADGSFKNSEVTSVSGVCDEQKF